MARYFWLDTDKWMLKEAVLEALKDGHKVKQIVVLSYEEVLVLLEESE